MLLVVVLAIWGVSQLLLSEDSGRAALPYSEVKRLVNEEPERIESLRFEPEDRTIVVTFRDGRTAETAYPSDASAAAFERTLDEQGVEYSSESGGTNAWWSFLIYLVPFLLFFGFWMFLMRRVERFGRSGSERPDKSEWWRRGG